MDKDGKSWVLTCFTIIQKPRATIYDMDDVMAKKVRMMEVIVDHLFSDRCDSLPSFMSRRILSLALNDVTTIAELTVVMAHRITDGRDRSDGK